MAVDSNVWLESFEAAADLSDRQHSFVVINSDGQVARNTVAGGRCAGVLQTKPAAQGRAAGVHQVNATWCTVRSGAAFAKGAFLMSDNAGRAVTATSGGHILGQAIEAATGADQFVTMQWEPAGAL